MKRTCWAQSLGDCSDKKTNEHLVTKGLFGDGSVFVQGLPWCPELKEVGIASLTAKLLCSKHNSDLSAADSAAIEAKKAFDAALDLMNFRMKYKKQRWSRKTFKVDGYPLESWFLKTLINVVHCGGMGFPVGLDSTESGMPSHKLVEIAFGIQRFSEPEGLYTVSMLGQTHDIDDRFRIVTLTKGNHVGGALFRFGSLNYLLHLESDSVPTVDSFALHLQSHLKFAHFGYRTRRTNFQVHDQRSHTVSFQW